jgi:hypothetical protein
MRQIWEGRWFAVNLQFYMRLLRRALVSRAATEDPADGRVEALESQRALDLGEAFS